MVTKRAAEILPVSTPKMIAAPSWETRRIALELPEEIDLEVELANVGSRSLAILVDIGLAALVLLIVYMLMLLFAHNLADDWITRLSSSALEIVLILLIFGFQWCYFTAFEWAWNGQTPGKRLLRLRVIKVDGSPVSGVDVILRNLSRPIDTLGPMGLFGLLIIFVSRKAQRLGDLMARTLVIHETKIDWSIFDEFTAENSAGALRSPALRLDSSQWELLHRFLNRRESLQSEARERLAVSLRENLLPAAKGTDLERSALPAEQWLLEVARRS